MTSDKTSTLMADDARLLTLPTSASPTSTTVGSAPAQETGIARAGGVPSSTFWAFFDIRTRGRFVLDVPIAAPVIMRHNSQVSASITELTAFGGTPFRGAAAMEIFNVVPLDGRLIVVGHIHWDADLFARVNLIIVN